MDINHFQFIIIIHNNIYKHFNFIYYFFTNFIMKLQFDLNLHINSIIVILLNSKANFIIVNDFINLKINPRMDLMSFYDFPNNIVIINIIILELCITLSLFFYDIFSLIG